MAYNNIVAQHPNEPGTIVAFSGGSLLNLAGKFGKYNVDNVRWLAGIGTDYGGRGAQRFAVHGPQGPDGGLQAGSDQDRAGAGGTVGSQDWITKRCWKG